MSLSLLIVDDEAPARERLRDMLQRIDRVGDIQEAGNGEEAIARCAETPFDIVLLDIRMPGMDGIEAAGHLATLSAPPAIVFTTAYDQYAVAAFETEAVGYLLKPVRSGRLSQALAKAARLNRAAIAALGQRTERRRQFVGARVGSDLKLIPVGDIRYFEADQKYVRAWHGDGSDLIDDSLKSLEEEFANRFVRTHRKVLVAVRHIERLAKTGDGGLEVQLRNDERRLPVSRRHVADVRAAVQT